MRILLRASTIAAPAVAGLLLCGCDPADASSDVATHRLLRTLLADRFTVGRLIGQDAWQECTPTDTTALIPGVRCPALRPGTKRFDRIDNAARAVRRNAGQESYTQAFRSNALLALRFAETSPAGLDRAVGQLEQAGRLAPEDPVILNELAVAYLALATRDQQLSPLLRALDAIEQATARDSTQPAILFNRALIRQRLYLSGSARRAWARYLAVERAGRWRAEAEAHAQRLTQAADTLPWRSLRESPPSPLNSTTEALIAVAATRSPQLVRDSCFVLLGEWGSALERGERVRAARLLGLVRTIGRVFERRNGDLGIALSLRAIDAVAADSRRLHALAQGHRGLATGIRLFRRSSFEVASATLSVAERTLKSNGSAASGWAGFYRAAAEMERGRHAAADSGLSAIRNAAGSQEPALAGRAIWGRGVVQVRLGNHEDASRLYREARPFLARAREPDNEAAISYLLSESLFLAGQTPASRAEALRGLRLLSPLPKTTHLNNHLTNVAVYARADGLSHAALAIMEEVLTVSRSLGRAEVLARAHRARARDLLALGRRDDARADVEAGLQWADSLPSEDARDRVRADVLLVLGQMVRDEDPQAALLLLNDVVETYRRVRIELHVPLALYEASLAAEGTGDKATARRQIAEAIVYFERQQASFDKPELRATFHETIENVFDAMIRLQLEVGRPDSAFVYLERARAAIQPVPGRRSEPVGPLPRVDLAQVVGELPEDMLFISYALLPDRLVAWTASRRGWRHHSLPVPRDSVAIWVGQLVAGLDDSGDAALQTRARLFDLLVRPAAAELSQARRLTVVPDRELYQVPFAALWDSRARRYLVEQQQTTIVPSGAFLLAAASLPAIRPVDMHALVIGDPTLGPGSPVRLDPLPHAVSEARDIARMYGRSVLLTREHASRGAVLRRLPDYQVFHFAGHAVFNGEQPELSYLALGPDRPGSDGTLRAWEIAELRSSTVKVVVLSACRTLSPRPSRAGAATGLAYSFLRAGVPATVSTLWDVRDDATWPLMAEFHRRLAAGATPGEALRQAQLQALRSRQPNLRVPAAWAAFIYTGP